MRTAILRAFLRTDPLGRSCVSSTPGVACRRSRVRSGFSIIEMLVVLIISGLVMQMALPRFAAMRDRMALRAAKQQIGGYLVTARAVAIRRSRIATFKVNNNTIWATAQKADGTDSTVTGTASLLAGNGVTVSKGGSTANDAISFDPRGMAMLPQARTYVLTRNSVKDSICISRLGLIARRCGQ